MDKKNLLDALCQDIESIEARVKILNDNIGVLNETLGGIKKTYSLLLEEEKNMAREITKDAVKVIQLKNGMANNSYEDVINLEEFNIPHDAVIEFEGIDQLRWNSEESKFEGELTSPGEFYGLLLYWNNDDDKENGKPKLERKVHILINADPRTLWKNIDPPTEGPFYKENTAFSFEKLGERTLLGVSIRGKSHAQKGTFRDDHFEVHAWDNGWVLQVVSDGAGSAEYSREGSKIACNSVLNKITEFIEIEKIKNVENLIVKLNTDSCVGNDDQPDVESSSEKISIKLEKASDVSDHSNNDGNEGGATSDEDIKRELSTLIHEITVQPAHFALKEIERFSVEKNYPIKKFSSTLLFALSKEFDFGTVVISFSIGDGAIGVITEKEGELLMKPDGGEYSGQTRFVTMKELFSSEIYKRTNFRLYKDKVEAIMLMSDGISDPKFGTENNLENSDMWFKLWKEIKPVLDNKEVNEKEMIEWMDFHEKGEYDDRTLTILY
ncbi:protein phosphatase 2C domain-containing protein [Puteibacter caeruleilacunae]|nr:protein phosphatase 2C domain-containing protein [Puteibacter caeruleilacunae]